MCELQTKKKKTGWQNQNYKGSQVLKISWLSFWQGIHPHAWKIPRFSGFVASRVNLGVNSLGIEEKWKYSCTSVTQMFFKNKIKNYFYSHNAQKASHSIRRNQLKADSNQAGTTITSVFLASADIHGNKHHVLLWLQSGFFVLYCPDYHNNILRLCTIWFRSVVRPRTLTGWGRCICGCLFSRTALICEKSAG